MERNYLLALACAGVLLFSLGCLGLGGESGQGLDLGGGVIGESAPAPNPATSAGSLDGMEDSSGRMVVKTGNAEVLVPAGALEERFSQLKALVNRSGGFVYGVTYGSTENRKYYYVTVKVPSAGFEAISGSLSSIGEVKSLSTDTSDVTQEYSDLSARIENLAAEKARLLEFYNRTGNVSELLQVEREVTRVQTELDQLTARRLQLENRVELATLNVRVYEETPLVDRTVMVPLNELVKIFLGALSFSLAVIIALAGFGLPFVLGLCALAVLLVAAKKLFWKGRK